MESAKGFVNQGVQWLKLMVEVMGAILIATGFLIVSGQFLLNVVSGGRTNFVTVGFVLARYMALALELPTRRRYSFDRDSPELDTDRQVGGYRGHSYRFELFPVPRDEGRAVGAVWRDERPDRGIANTDNLAAAQDLSGTFAGHSTILENGYPVHEHIRESDRGATRIFRGRGIPNGARVEEHDIGFLARCDPAAIPKPHSGRG